MDAALDINTVLGIAIAYALSMIARYVAKTKFWDRVKRDAKADLEDPNTPMVAPQVAVEKALVAAQSGRVRKIAESLAPPISIGRTPTIRGMPGPRDTTKDEDEGD